MKVGSRIGAGVVLLVIEAFAGEQKSEFAAQNERYQSDTCL